MQGEEDEIDPELLKRMTSLEDRIERKLMDIDKILVSPKPQIK